MRHDLVQMHLQEVAALRWSLRSTRKHCSMPRLPPYPDRMHLPMTIILGIDPGETTGWSVWKYDDAHAPEHLDHGMIPGGLKGFIRWFDDTDGLDEVVCESFRLDGRTDFPNVTPLRIEGALAALWPETHFQPNTMKLHLSDRKMKELGLWWPGAGHDRDSMRHVFAFLKTRRHRPTLELWKPAQV